MKLQEVTIDDGRHCAQLITFLNNGRWDMSASDADVFYKVKYWLQGMAKQMAEQLKAADPKAPPTAPPAPPSGFRVKNVGSLPQKTSKKRKK